MADEHKDDPGQKTMIRWILGLVAGGLGAVGVWVGSQMKSDSEFSRKLAEAAALERVENVKVIQMLASNIAANTDAMKGVQKVSEETVKYLRDIRDDTRKFPAVREAMERPE